jgi:hypothetical protein
VSIASMPVGQAPDQVLQQAMMGMVPDIKPYEALTELHNRVKNKKAAMAMQGNNAIQQAQQIQQQPPIAAQIAQANNALGAGIGGLPVPTSNAYSGGGIVAFSNGGFIDRLPEGSGARALRDWVRAGRPPLSRPLLDMLFDREQTQSDSLPRYTPEFPEVAMQDIPEVTVEDVATPDMPPAAPAGAATASGQAQARAGASTTRPHMPAWPQAKTAVPQLTPPDQRTSAELRAEDEAQVKPRLSAYDERMQRFRDRAEALKRGDGVRDPSRLERGLGGFMAGATDEVMAARRAGVRPSLGMALAGAARSATAEDSERQNLRRELEEKGYQLEMTLEAQRNAYERGEFEMANKYGEAARRLAGERNSVLNRQAELEATGTNTDIARDEARTMRERQEEVQFAEMRSREAIAREAAAARAANANAGDDTARRRADLATLVRMGPYLSAMEVIKRNAPLVGSMDPNSRMTSVQRQQLEQAFSTVDQLMRMFNLMPEDNPEVIAYRQQAGIRTGTGATMTPAQRALVEQYSR